MYGALVLTLSGLISRILGAFLRPIVARLFARHDGSDGLVGMGYTAPPANTYQVFLAFASVGINVAVSYLIAERLARKDYAGAWRVFRVSFALMAALGLALSLLFAAISRPLAALVGVPESAPGFLAISPAIFLVSVMSAYRGLFQGLQQMTPYAVSQVYEQLVRVVTAIALVWVLAPISVPLGAAGFNVGAVTGPLIGIVYLIGAYRRQTAWLQAESAAAVQQPQEPTGSLLRRIIVLAAPIAFIGAALPLFAAADSSIIVPVLERAGVPGATAELGKLTNATTVIHLPPIITTSLAVSLVPAVSEALANDNPGLARHRAATALRFTFITGLPMTVGLAAVAEHVFRILFSAQGAGPVMAAIAPATILLMLQQTLSGTLQGMGLVGLTARNLLLGALAKLASTYYLSAIPALGVHGAAIGWSLGFGLSAALNFWAVQRHLGSVLEWRSMLLKPLLASGVMWLVIWLTEPVVLALLGSPNLTGLALMALGAGVYGLVMLLIGGLSRQDFEMVPKVGRRLANLLEKLKLLRG